MLRSMFRSCFRKGLTLLWNLRGISKDMRSYSYTCLLPRYRFLETLRWILTTSIPNPYSEICQTVLNSVSEANSCSIMAFRIKSLTASLTPPG
jgi:hypothetical protein